MTTENPRNVPATRDWLARSWKPGRCNHGRWMSAIHGTGHELVWRDDDAKHTVRRLSQADLYWVSPEICALIEEASSTIPDESTWNEAMIPSRNILLFFAKARALGQLPGSFKGLEICVQHVRMGIPVQDGQPVRDQRMQSLLVDEYSSDSVGPIHIGTGVWPSGETLDMISDSSDVPDHILQNRAEGLAARRHLLALFAIMSSPGVTETRRTSPSPNKSARRREGDVTAVRLIYLRGQSGNSHVGSNRDYHHRWIVSGHWRLQPYGPASALRRPMWIRPHLKGPEGAPLLTGDKVHVLS